jgi:lipopolysaccharide transport system ATP-binding protein
MSDGDVFAGISRFFSEGITSPARTLNPEIQQQPTAASASDYPAGMCLEIVRDALWCNKLLDPKAELIAIALYDEFGKPSTSFRLGTELLVKVLFAPVSGVANHISLAILDKSGEVRSATGSLLQKLSGHTTNEVGLFEIRIQLMIEAGEYGLLLNLGYEIEKNRGVIVHEAPIIGPINVTWDYELETAPFLGQVGLPVSAHFVSLEEME